MTLQKEDILLLEELIERIVRKVIKEEMNKANSTEQLQVSNQEKKLVEEVFTEYKDVFDALA